MVKLASSIGFSIDVEEARQRLQGLQEEYADLQTQYTHLKDVVGPNLQTRYLQVLGRLEYSLFVEQMTLLQLKREIALYQSAANRGEPLSEQEVQAVLEEEFVEYQKQMQEQKVAQDKAEKALLTEQPGSVEETQAIKKLFHQLVKKIHPDLHPEQSPELTVLWNKIQEAYHDMDWVMLQVLADMTDRHLQNGEPVLEEQNSLEQLQAKIEKTSTLCDAMTQLLAGLQSKPPFTYVDLVYDVEKVQQRRGELEVQLNAMKEQVRALELLRDQLCQNLSQGEGGGTEQ